MSFNATKYCNDLYASGAKWEGIVKNYLETEKRLTLRKATREEDYYSDTDLVDERSGTTVSVKSNTPQYYDKHQFSFELYKIYEWSPNEKKPAWLYRETPPDYIYYAKVFNEEKQLYDLWALDHELLMEYIKEHGFCWRTLQKGEVARKQYLAKGVIETGLGLISHSKLEKAGVAKRIYSNVPVVARQSETTKLKLPSIPKPPSSRVV